MVRPANSFGSDLFLVPLNGAAISQRECTGQSRDAHLLRADSTRKHLSGVPEHARTIRRSRSTAWTDPDAIVHSETSGSPVIIAIVAAGKLATPAASPRVHGEINTVGSRQCIMHDTTRSSIRQPISFSTVDPVSFRSLFTLSFRLVHTRFCPNGCWYRPGSWSRSRNKGRGASNHVSLTFHNASAQYEHAYLGSVWSKSILELMWQSRRFPFLTASPISRPTLSGHPRQFRLVSFRQPTPHVIHPRSRHQSIDSFLLFSEPRCPPRPIKPFPPPPHHAKTQHRRPALRLVR